MMERFGDPQCIAIKRRIACAVMADEPPSALTHDRHGRTSIRIALRQLKAAGHASPVLQAWLAAYDPVGAEADNEDEAALQHNC